MPCYEPPRGDPFTSSKSEIRNEIKKELAEHSRNNDLLAGQVGFLSAAICAISSELDRRGIQIEVFQEASRKGKIDLMDFLVEHRDDDKSRITADIHRRYSVDELELIKSILK